jgi:hypothetical protein
MRGTETTTMAYADPIDPATPGDGNFAGQGDDRIRELKRALIERLSTFFVDINADPLVPKAGAVPADSSPAITDLKNSLASFYIDMDDDPLVPKPNSIPQNAIQGGVAPEGGTNTSALQDGSVTEPKLHDDSVSNRTIQDNAVLGVNIKDLEISTPKLGDGAVTLGKVNSALKDLVTTVKTATIALTQAQTVMASGTFREYDLDVPGAVAGSPAYASWQNATYPSGGALPAAGNPGWSPGDGIRLQAWCLVDAKVRVRLANLTSAGLDMGVAGVNLTVYVWQTLADEP